MNIHEQQNTNNNSRASVQTVHVKECQYWLTLKVPEPNDVLPTITDLNLTVKTVKTTI